MAELRGLALALAVLAEGGSGKLSQLGAMASGMLRRRGSDTSGGKGLIAQFRLGLCGAVGREALGFCTSARVVWGRGLEVAAPWEQLSKRRFKWCLMVVDDRGS